MIIVAADTPAPPPETFHPISKDSGSVRFMFISRICRSKNLLGAIRLLNGLHGQGCLDIYGPAEDEKYWALCQREIATLPENISVGYHGPIHPDQVIPAFQRSHFFLFPTQTESFGHVIYESLCAGRPVITSSATPWCDLSACECGWALPLTEEISWRWVLQRCVNMEDGEYQESCSNAHRFAHAWYKAQDFRGQYTRLFDAALNYSLNSR